MFTYACDETDCSMVVIQWPGAIVDASFRDVLVTIVRVGAGKERPLRLICLIKDGAEAPNPQQRRDILAAIGALPQALYVSVTRSAVHRGTITALTWSDPTLRERDVALATAEEAYDWLRRESGQDSTTLRRLMNQAERAGLRTWNATPSI